LPPPSVLSKLRKIHDFETKVLIVAQEAAIKDGLIANPPLSDENKIAEGGEAEKKSKLLHGKTMDIVGADARTEPKNRDKKKENVKRDDEIMKSQEERQRRKGRGGLFRFLQFSFFSTKSKTKLFNLPKEDGERLRLPRDEARDLLKTIAVYVCSKCQRSYCGGRVECARDFNEVDKSNLLCQKCMWSSIVGDHKCERHGVRHAMFKCDSCCNIATYDCIYNHYCDRCHALASKKKCFPCPGSEKCSLGIPHPPNLPAKHGGERNRIEPFVIGCMACATGIEDDASANPFYLNGYRF